MRVLDVELAFTLGHNVNEAVRALEDVGLTMLPGHHVVPMRGKQRTTYLVTIQDPLGDAEQRVRILDGVADVVGIFGSPEVMSFVGHQPAHS